MTDAQWNGRWGGHWTRRQWLQRSAVASVTTLAALRTASAIGTNADEWNDSSRESMRALAADDARMVSLAQTGVAAATGAGAVYADARLTYWRMKTLIPTNPQFDPQLYDVEEMTAGVRALVGGYWGFASGPVWTTDDLARLGREATAIARANNRSLRREVTLAPAPVVQNARWHSPVDVDPFDVSEDEIFDLLGGVSNFAETRLRMLLLTSVGLSRRIQAFASSEGSTWAYTHANTRGILTLGNNVISRAIPIPPGTSAGWERLRNAPLYTTLERVAEEIQSNSRMPVKAAELSRADIVLSAEVAARVLGETLGDATQLDRAMGEEANGVGTSYLNDPLTLLGTPVASSVVTVSGDRTQVGGEASLPWDDDGVAATTCTLVQNGTLVDFQTTRESASWLAPWYASRRVPVRSNGCAAAATALFPPITQSPNLTLHSTGTAPTVDALLERLGTGVYCASLQLNADYQCLNGTGSGEMYDVKNGKRVARLVGGSILFRAPQLWQNVVEVAGPATARSTWVWSNKGQPVQPGNYTVSAPPMLVKGITIRGSE